MPLTIVRFAYKREWANPFLDRWLRQRAVEGHVIRDGNWQQPLDLCRNLEVQRFLDHDTTDAILLVDSDMVPVPESDEILACDAPIVGCPYIGQSGHMEHPGEGSVAAGWLRISREAAKTIGPPWFSFGLDGTGCGKATCECGYFSAKARAAGLTPVKVGRVGHLVRLVALPSDAGGVAFRMEHLFADMNL